MSVHDSMGRCVICGTQSPMRGPFGGAPNGWAWSTVPGANGRPALLCRPECARQHGESEDAIARLWPDADEIERIRAKHARLSTSPAVPDKTAPAFGTDEAGRLLVALDMAGAEVERMRRRIETMPPWPRDGEPLSDEQMRALKLRWSTGPERYQADADALIATVLHERAESARLRGEIEEAGAALEKHNATLRAINAELERLVGAEIDRALCCEDHRQRAEAAEAELERLRQVAADHLWLLRADDASCTCEAGDICPLCRAERAIEGQAPPEASQGVRLQRELREAHGEVERLQAEKASLVARLRAALDEEASEEGLESLLGIAEARLELFIDFGERIEKAYDLIRAREREASIEKRFDEVGWLDCLWTLLGGAETSRFGERRVPKLTLRDNGAIVGPDGRLVVRVVYADDAMARALLVAADTEWQRRQSIATASERERELYGGSDG